MRYSNIIILILTLIFSSFSNPKAISGDALVDAVKKYYLKAESIHAQFKVHSFHSLLRSTNIYEGSIYVEGGDFQLKTPSVELVLKECIFWKYSKQNEQVTVSNNRCNDPSLNPLSILKTMLKWDVKKVRKYTEHRKDPQYKINFIPKEEFYTKASLFVSSSFVPRKIILVDVAGNETTYTLKKVQRNIKQQIHFKKPLGVEVIDLRK